MDGAASLWGDSLVPSLLRVVLGGRTSSARKLVRNRINVGVLVRLTGKLRKTARAVLNEIFSGRQPHQDVRFYGRFGN